MTVESPTRSCPRCDARVASDAKFCANCGQALAEPSSIDATIHSRLTAAAPTPLITKMRAARLTGERTPVTPLLADVVGPTTLAGQMDPEDWTAMINEAFDLMSGAVFRYEGTIAQLQGDAMLAFFGAPVAHEDDPERAIFAALDMLEATAEFAAQLKSTHGIDFRIRAGINSGPVMVGNVGSDLRYEYTALGDAVNVAARMQTAAEPGSVLITDATYRFVAHAVDATDLGPIEVKGKAEPVRAYRVVGLKAQPTSARGPAIHTGRRGRRALRIPRQPPGDPAGTGRPAARPGPRSADPPGGLPEMVEPDPRGSRPAAADRARLRGHPLGRRVIG